MVLRRWCATSLDPIRRIHPAVVPILTVCIQATPAALSRLAATRRSPGYLGYLVRGLPLLQTRSTVCGLGLAAVLLILTSGPHLHLTVFGLVPPVTDVDKSGAIPRVQQAHCAFYLFGMVLRMSIRSIYEVHYVYRDLQDASQQSESSQGAASDSSSYFATLPPSILFPALAMLSLCLVPAAKRPAFLRFMFYAGPVLESLRVAAACALQGWPDGTFFVVERQAARQIPGMLQANVVAIFVSTLHFGSILDLSLKEIAICMAFFVGRLALNLVNPASWRTSWPDLFLVQTLPVTLILAAIISAYLLKPRVLRKRRTAREESVIVEELSHYATTRVSGQV